MSKTLSKSLGTDIIALAEMLRSKGRGNDTILAHITPKEAALLKRRGGRGSINPDTGLPEFLGGDDGISFDFGESGASAADWNPPAGDAGGGSSAGGDPAVLPQGGFDMSQYAGQPAPTIDSSVTGEGAFAPGAQEPATTPYADPSTYYGTTAPDAGAGGGKKPDQTWYEKLLTPENLAKLGILGGLGAYGAQKGTQSSQQGQAAAQQVAALAPQITARSDVAQQQFRDIGANITAQTKINADELAALGAPQRELGLQLMSQAQSGTLTPAGQRALAALKAQSRQNISKRGGVGAMQAGVAEEEATANLLQQQLQQGLATYGQGAQYSASAIGMNQQAIQAANGMQVAAINTGLQQAGIADQYTIGAINLALANDKATAQSLQNFYAQLASVGFGIKSPTAPAA
jgi:hypothetical protein